MIGQAQLQADVRAAWASIAGRYQGRKLVVYGRSLGSGLAAVMSVELAPHAQLLPVPGAAHKDLQDFPVYLDGFSGALAAL